MDLSIDGPVELMDLSIHGPVELMGLTNCLANSQQDGHGGGLRTRPIAGKSITEGIDGRNSNRIL